MGSNRVIKGKWAWKRVNFSNQINSRVRNIGPPRGGTYTERVVGSNLVSSKILYGNGVKAMPGLIPAPNSGSL